MPRLLITEYQQGLNHWKLMRVIYQSFKKQTKPVHIKLSSQTESLAKEAIWPFG